MKRIFYILWAFFKRIFTFSNKEGENIEVNGDIVSEIITIETMDKTMAEKKLHLLVERIFTCSDYTIGKLYIDGEYFCDTIEDCDRMLDSQMSLETIKKNKIKDETAIPTGKYEIDMDTQSPKYSDYAKYKWAKEFDGKLPRLQEVPGYAGVLIHVGNTAAHTSGCLLVGKNTEKGKITSSTVWFQTLMKKYLLPAHKNGIKIDIEYKRTY